MKWIDLYIQKGVYISREFDISSNFEVYRDELKYHYELNDGEVKVFVRMSYDTSTWTEWVQVNNSAYLELFRDEYYNMEYAKFQYKIELINHGVFTPIFRSFSYMLRGSYLLINTGDLICKPELWITKRNGAGTIKLTNETNGQTLVFENLNNNEEVYVDCENEDIMTSLPMKYRYDDHNDVFLELDVGENLLTGEGEFDLTIRHEFKTLQG
ncbi:phage tail domain-containing protein [Paenibacillus agilis]|uniref:phage tail domain-containing protein n=1 Tax=Paenibacillus agilis TaxID=3020863 RepID=UPI001C982CAF|nr:phage tail domain-containing protein [Paenibacillus agilis]